MNRLPLRKGRQFCFGPFCLGRPPPHCAGRPRARIFSQNPRGSVALHLIKLCVGADSVADLAAWQKQRLAERKRAGGPAEIRHVTRQTPKRAEDLLDGGSLYWVVKGQIAVRQRILALKPVTEDGVPHCAIVLDKDLVPTVRRGHRAFQG